MTAERPVLVTTEYRGVFFGYRRDKHAAGRALRQAGKPGQTRRCGGAQMGAGRNVNGTGVGNTIGNTSPPKRLSY